MSKPRIAVIGATGRFGSRIYKHSQKSYEVFAVIRSVNSEFQSIQNTFNCDVLQYDQVIEVVKLLKFCNVRTIINCTGDVRVDMGEKTHGDKKSNMYKVNVLGADNVARACKLFGIKLIHLSTEYVFPGDKEYGSKYEEDDKTVADLNVKSTWYGLTKAMGEKKVILANPNVIIIRFSQIQGPTFGVFSDTLKKLSEKKKFTRSSDQMISPITDRTAIDALHEIEQALHSRNLKNIIHVSSTDALTVYETAKLLAEKYSLLVSFYKKVKAKSLEDIVKAQEQQVIRPINSILDVNYFNKNIKNGLFVSVEKEIVRYHSLYLAG